MFGVAWVLGLSLCWRPPLLKPILSPDYLPEFVLDSLAFLNDFEAVRDGSHVPEYFGLPIDQASEPWSVGVSNMYHNIPPRLCAEACARAWAHLREVEFPSHPVTPDMVKRTVKFVLSHSTFTFEGTVYSIVGGPAMGVKLAVVLANAFMSYLWQHFVSSHMALVAKIGFVKRFLDDLSGFWYGSEGEFNGFVFTLNEWCTNNGYQIQFVVSDFGSPCNLLDMTIYRGQSNKWETRLFYKSSSVHAFLLPSSAHPRHIAKNIPKGVWIRGLLVRWGPP